MNICFVNIKNNIFNTSIAALSASLKQEGFHPTIIHVNYDKNLDNLVTQNIVNRFSEELSVKKPDLLLFSLMSPAWPIARILTKIAKENTNPYIVCGGYHPTLFPEEVINYAYVDAICLGEGDLVIKEFVKKYAEDGDYKTVNNFWFKSGNKIIKNKINNLIGELDVLPFWDRDIFITDKMTSQTGIPVIFQQKRHYLPKDFVAVCVTSGRGCFYNCSYCSNKSMRNFYKGKGIYVRHRTPDNLIEELLLLKKRYSPGYFEFTEEIFPVEKKWLEEFKTKYVLTLNIPFGLACNIRTSSADRLRLLKDAGCKVIYFGIECGNEKYRKEILNKNISNEEIKKVIRTLKELKINTISFNMIGLPFEPLSNMMETIEFNRQIEIDFSIFFSYQPFVGTDLYYKCLDHDLLEKKDVLFFTYDKSILRSEVKKDEYEKIWGAIRKLQDDQVENKNRIL